MAVKPVLRIDQTLVRRILVAGALSLFAWTTLELATPRPVITWSTAMVRAASRMDRAVTTIAQYCDSVGFPIDASLDTNHTCLVGPEYTPLLTTLGQLEAKRTTTNPDVAALLVHLLTRAGVSAQDTIAVGASGSFPALLIATQSAAEEMRVFPVIVLSLGASSYGATRPDFNLLDMHQLLVAQGVLGTPVAAVSLGGERDIGAEFDGSLRDDLARRVGATGIPFLHDPDLAGSVARRMEIYRGVTTEQRIGAFVNIGGSDANIGTSPMVLDVTPGLHTDLRLPPPSERGVLYEMAAQGVPVIHLLHIRGLALQHGLPWDPVPLPEPGTTQLRDDLETRTALLWLIAAAYLVSLGVALLWRGSKPFAYGVSDFR